MKTYSDDEIEALLQEHPLWKRSERSIARDWVFPDFTQAMAFVNLVAALAETANHHPDIDIRYNQVRLELISHDAGGITGRDAAMIRRINALGSGAK